jgi:c-di-GMP-binding flagellar brake protein YcgR
MMMSKLEAFLSLEDKLDITISNPRNELEQYTYRSGLVAVHKGTAVVDRPPLSDAAFSWFKPTETVKVVIHRSNGVYSFFSDIDEASTNHQLVLTLPANAEHTQRRKHVRVNHMFEVKLIMPATDEAPARVHRCVAVDVSAGGLRLKTPVALAVDDLVNAHFTLSSNLGALSLEAKVVYGFADTTPRSAQSRLSKQPPLPFVTAFQFTTVDAELERKIIQECFRLELEAHRKGLLTH